MRNAKGSDIKRIFVNSLLGCALIINGKIPMERAAQSVLLTANMRSFGAVTFGDITAELIVMRTADLDDKFMAKGCQVVTTDEFDSIL